MSFPLMPFPAFNAVRGTLSAFSTGNTNDIEVGDFLLILQTNTTGATLPTTPSGAAVLVSATTAGARAVKGSIKIADVSDIGASWDFLSQVLVMRRSHGKAIAFSSDVGSGTISTLGYGKPLGAMNLVYRDSGDAASTGTIDGNSRDVGYSNGDAFLEIEGGLWVGDFSENPTVSIVNGQSESGAHNWRFVYAV